MSKKCQVCDGPIVNGRCKYCGMPYRNDEVLYHLNESRKDHYRHATPEARKIMRQQAVPAKDRREAQKGAAHGKSIAYGKSFVLGKKGSSDKGVSSGSRTFSKEEIRANQEKVRQAAVERMTTVKPHTAGSSQNQRQASRSMRTSGTGNTFSTQTVRDYEGRRMKWGASKFSILITLIIVLGGILPTIVKKYEERRYYDTATAVSGEAEPLAWFESDGKRVYGLKPGNGEVPEDEIEGPGSYVACVESGTATLIKHSASGVQNYGLSEDIGYIVVELKEGDTLSVGRDITAEYVLLAKLDSDL